MATHGDITERRKILFGDKSAAPGAASATLATLVQQLAEVVSENDRLVSQMEALKGGLLDELRTAINAAPRPSAQVVPLNQGSAPAAAPGPASGQPKSWVLETSDSMGNPRRVRVTPEFK